MMSVVFETPRFRVQIAGKTAWVENRESAGWILRAQHAIPISGESLAGADHANLLNRAVLDFEDTRPGDTALRSALTGDPEPLRPRNLGAERPHAALPRFVKESRFRSKPDIARQLWSPRPLRPPLKPIVK
jgi:hypothetical protein